MKTGKVMGLPDGTPVKYIGRDDKTYPLYDNAVNIIPDDPNGTHPLSVLLIQDKKIVKAALTDESFLIEMGKDKQIMDENGKPVNITVN